MDLEHKLDKLFLAYKSANPDPIPSAGFTPGVWHKIEARRRQSFLLSWTRNLVAASASLCMIFGLLLVTPFPSGNSALATYLDSLDDEHDQSQVAELHQVVIQDPSNDYSQAILVEEE